MPMKQDHKDQAKRLKELVDIANDQTFQDVVSAVENDQNAISQANQNPEAYLKSKGVRLPHGAKVTFKDHP